MKEYRCTKCSAVLVEQNDKLICKSCNYIYDKKSFENSLFAIPFSITIKDAKKIYKKNIKSTLLTPSYFLSSKNINKIEAMYVPVYIYSIDSTGVVDFECDKDNLWKSSGIKYRKTDVYKISLGGNMTINNLVINATKDIDNGTLESILPYDYNKLEIFNNTNNYKLCSSNKNKKELLNDIKSISKKVFVNQLKTDIKDYNNLKEVDNSINIYNPKNKYILLPIYVLNLDFKGKKYTYAVNGSNGNFSGDIPINEKRLIFIGIFIFIFIFSCLCLFQVIL